MWTELLAGLGHVMTTVVLPAAATTAAAYGTQWAARQSAKVGLELTVAQQQALKQQVLDVLMRTEERGRRENLTGADKQRIAADAIKAQITDKGKVLTDLQAVTLMDTMLPEMRAHQALVDPPQLPEPEANLTP